MMDDQTFEYYVAAFCLLADIDRSLRLLGESHPLHHHDATDEIYEAIPHVRAAMLDVQAALTEAEA